MVKIDFRKRKALWIGAFFFVFLLIAIAVYIFFFAKKDVVENKEDEFNPNDIVTHSVDVPEETLVKEFYVPPDLPKIITIPAIGVRGYIQSVGVDQDDQIAVPTNVHLTGWYINSVKPGEKGLSILDGHRDGATLGGVFRNLEKLKKGDKISIEYGDGSVRNFKVVDLKRIPTEDAYDFMYSRIEGVEAQLNMVTCGGKWIKEEKTYEDRIILRAERV